MQVDDVAAMVMFTALTIIISLCVEAEHEASVAALSHLDEPFNRKRRWWERVAHDACKVDGSSTREMERLWATPRCCAHRGATGCWAERAHAWRWATSHDLEVLSEGRGVGAKVVGVAEAPVGPEGGSEGGWRAAVGEGLNLVESEHHVVDAESVPRDVGCLRRPRARVNE